MQAGAPPRGGNRAKLGDISTPIIGVDMSPLWGGYVTLVLVHPDVLFTCLVGTGA